MRGITLTSIAKETAASDLKLLTDGTEYFSDSSVY